MLSTDVYITLHLHEQRTRRLWQEAAADTLARRVRRQRRLRAHDWWRVPHRRLRAPAVP